MPHLITNHSIIVRTPKTKSLLPSPAYRQAGFTKGRNYPSLAIFFLPDRQARGARGDFSKQCLPYYGLLINTLLVKRKNL
jgi:hypothetical protein